MLKDLEKPSDELIKYFLTQPEIKPNHRITSNMIERYREITAKTIRKIMGVTITNNNFNGLTDNIENTVIEEIPTETPQQTVKTLPDYCICCKRTGKYLYLDEEGFCPMCADTATEEQKLNAKREAGLI